MAVAHQKYKILTKLDSGGMAEVWKGKTITIGGLEKLVAIKRVLPELSQKDDFMKMFLDEARLSLHLSHANIVHTFDIGGGAADSSSDGALFIVMEWVDGINLKGVIDHLRDKNIRIPIKQAVYIAAEICKGLYHAHLRTTPEGKPLKIVHRDISPPNILISREGEVKIVDFGLAKASSHNISTAKGMVKGKFGYLSPEAAMGEEVDERADLFAVGIILWEMIAGKRLFDGANNRETLLAVRAAQIPPLASFNRDVDPALARIIEKSLTKSKEDRYPNAKSMGIELIQYLFDRKLAVNAFDIAQLAELAIFEREQAKSKAQFDELEDLDDIVKQLDRFTSLEDLQKMSFKPVSEQGFAQPAFKTEDPRAWLKELDEEVKTPLPYQPGGNTQSFRKPNFAPIQTEPQVSSIPTPPSYQPPLQASATPIPKVPTPHQSNPNQPQIQTQAQAQAQTQAQTQAQAQAQTQAQQTKSTKDNQASPKNPTPSKAMEPLDERTQRIRSIEASLDAVKAKPDQNQNQKKLMWVLLGVIALALGIAFSFFFS
jgi:serine/threonine protein kinase